MKLFTVISFIILLCSCKKQDTNICIDYKNQDSLIELCFECNNGIWRMESDTVVEFNIIEISKHYSIIEFPITIPLEFKKDIVEYRTVTYPNHLEEDINKCDSFVLYNEFMRNNNRKSRRYYDYIINSSYSGKTRKRI